MSPAGTSISPWRKYPQFMPEEGQRVFAAYKRGDLINPAGDIIMAKYVDDIFLHDGTDLTLSVPDFWMPRSPLPEEK